MCPYIPWLTEFKKRGFKTARPPDFFIISKVPPPKPTSLYIRSVAFSTFLWCLEMISFYTNTVPCSPSKVTRTLFGC